MARVIVDTSVLIRLVTGEPADQASRARRALEAAAEAGEEIVIHPLVLSEMVFVLNGPRLRIPRDEQVQAVELVMDIGSAPEDHKWLKRALDWYRDSGVGWLDCLLGSYAAEAAEGNVLTFDSDFARLPGLNSRIP